MSRLKVLLIAFALLLQSLQAAEKPNILFILADDMGYMDLACNGSDLYRTPNIDRLAAQGMRFTRAYSASHVCSPTRASLLTGKYPARVQLTDWLSGHNKPFAKLKIPDWTKGLPASEVTLAEMLGPQGYATAWLGKWHLGAGAQDHGFDAGNQSWTLNKKQDAEDPKGVFTLAAEAIEFMDKNREKPFFVGLSHYSPHGPVRYDDALRDEYQKIIAEKKPRQTNAGYAAMIEALDTSVGQVLDWLEKNQLADNTLVIFFSDNGGALSYTNNAPLRAGKGSHYEGGVRVPMIARWPGKIAAGSTSEEKIFSTDFFTTFAALAGVSLPTELDGVDITPVLNGSGKLKREALYWHYPHYHATKPSGAIMNGDWKLIEWFETGEAELYDLASDPAEEKNLAAQNPEKTAALLAELKAWQKSVGAQMPTPNPDYDPENPDRKPEKKAKKQKGKNAGKKEKKGRNR